MIKTAQEIEKMTEAGRIVGEAHRYIREFIQPEITTLEINDLLDKFIRENGGYPTFLGQYDFPKSVCISINEEIIHGIPGVRKLKDGDLVKIDIGCTKDGFIGDSAWTYPVGEVSQQAMKLMEAGEQSLYNALKNLRDGVKLALISSTIFNTAKKYKFSVVKEFCGHGVGRSLHEAPEIPNFVNRKKPNITFKTGMTVAIEPMVNAGTSRTKALDDDWTVVTQDGKLSVHYEHTVVIIPNGCLILTENGFSTL